MDPSPSRVDPKKVLEPKVLAQRNVHDLNRDCHQLPAARADLRVLAARAHVVVVCHVDIKHELFLNRLERSNCVVLLGRRVEHGADVRLVRQPLQVRRAVLLRVLERQVPDVDVARERERELTAHEKIALAQRVLVVGAVAVAQPPIHAPKREQPLVVLLQHLIPHAAKFGPNTGRNNLHLG